MQPSAEQVRSDYEALSDDFPYDAEQQSITAISPPPLEDLSYEANDSVLTPLEDFSYEADDSILTIDNNLPCSCDTPALQVLKTIVGQWRKEWESESMWNKVFYDLFGHAHMKGEHATTTFLDECTQHIREGRTILDSINDVMHTHCLCCREHLKYDTILLHDLLICVMSQVKFFEVKLDTGCN
jgi:hypothetical protein